VVRPLSFRIPFIYTLKCVALRNESNKLRWLQQHISKAAFPEKWRHYDRERDVPEWLMLQKHLPLWTWQ